MRGTGTATVRLYRGGNGAYISGPVLRIRIGFNADPDAAFYLNADPDPESQTYAGPCGSGSWSDFAATRSLILA